MRAMSEQVSSTIGLLPAVDPSLSLMHSPVATDFTRYFPDAAVDAVNVHSWFTFVPSPHPYCCNWVPETVLDEGTSMQRVELTFARLNWPFARAVAVHCWSLAAVLQATWTSSALLSTEAPVTSTHL